MVSVCLIWFSTKKNQKQPKQPLLPFFFTLLNYVQQAIVSGDVCCFGWNRDWKWTICVVCVWQKTDNNNQIDRQYHWYFSGNMLLVFLWWELYTFVYLSIYLRVCVCVKETYIIRIRILYCTLLVFFLLLNVMIYVPL